MSFSTSNRLWRTIALIGAVVLAVAGLTTTAVGAASGGRTPAARSTTAPLPGFRDGYVSHGPARVHYVVGGHGPALVLLHGWPETWYAWAGVMPGLARTHTVVAVDLRGLGASSPAPTDAGSYTASAVATDVQAVVRRLGLDRTGPFDLAGHDWGGNIAIALAAAHPAEVRRLAVLEAPATVDYTNLVQQDPRTFWWDWFINGSAPGLPETLVNSHPDTFYQPFYANSGGAISPGAVRRYLAAYSKPAVTHAGFQYFRAQDEGERQVQALIDAQGKLTMPVLAVGGRHSMGTLVGTTMKHVATTVTSAVVPDANHWVIEEQPGYVLDLLTRFLDD
jgi:pimeloyl-ACP methyl ester carboxylesterase